MLFFFILNHYIIWHYTNAFREIFHVWKNLMWFTYHFFSIPQMFRSYISPWKRMTEEKGSSFDFEDIASFIIINLISRIIGIILRTIVIIAGLFSLLTLIIGIVATYIFWLLMPVFIVTSVYYGFVLIFS
jgi:hypothetical protein